MIEQPDKRPRDTREFLAQWNAATEEHLTTKLTGILQQLSRQEPGLRGLTAEHCAALAPRLLRALQVAAAPDGTVHDALDLLAAAATEPPEGEAHGAAE
jgi:glutamine synthetase adenylyltransferase